MNLRSIYQSLQLYALENDAYPSSQEELVRYCGDSRLFHCDEPNAPMYVYIPGQRGDMPPTNVLLYEPEPVHGGQCSVLFLNGQMALLTPEELKLAVEATKASRFWCASPSPPRERFSASWRGMWRPGSAR